MNAAIYTAVYGPYDWVKPIPDLGVPAYFYTDSEVTAALAKAAGWQPRVVPHGIATGKGDPAVTAPMLAHKWWKTHPGLACPDADWSMWIDGSMEVTAPDYVALCEQALGYDDWVMVKHPWRDCAIEEGYYSATLTWRYDHDALHAQTDFYAQWHPRHAGLFASGANVRRHTPAVLEFGQKWWLECLNWSHQDQVSLPVLLRMMETNAAHGYQPGDTGYIAPFNWNTNMPWEQWWKLHPHGPGGDA